MMVRLKEARIEVEFERLDRSKSANYKFKLPCDKFDDLVTDSRIFKKLVDIEAKAISLLG